MWEVPRIPAPGPSGSHLLFSVYCPIRCGVRGDRCRHWYDDAVTKSSLNSTIKELSRGRKVPLGLPSHRGLRGGDRVWRQAHMPQGSDSGPGLGSRVMGKEIGCKWSHGLWCWVGLRTASLLQQFYSRAPRAEHRCYRWAESFSRCVCGTQFEGRWA